jgi:hypothetical protein
MGRQRAVIGVLIAACWLLGGSLAASLSRPVMPLLIVLAAAVVAELPIAALPHADDGADAALIARHAPFSRPSVRSAHPAPALLRTSAWWVAIVVRAALLWLGAAVPRGARAHHRHHDDGPQRFHQDLGAAQPHRPVHGGRRHRGRRRTLLPAPRFRRRRHRLCPAPRLAGGKLRGGSTISQQTAKNVFLWQGTGWTRYLRKGWKPGSRWSSKPSGPRAGSWKCT